VRNTVKPQDEPDRHRPDRFDALPIDEPEIDRILAESFPASDPPPWTLGMPEQEPADRPHDEQRREPASREPQR
jgi:hypothetical protein